MATIYTFETYSNDVLPGGYTKEMKDLIAFGVSQAWKVQVKGLVVRLLPPQGDKVITLSASHHNPPIQGHKNTIIKYGNPLAVTPAAEVPQVQRLVEKVHSEEKKAEVKKLFKKKDAPTKAEVAETVAVIDEALAVAGNRRNRFIHDVPVLDVSDAVMAEEVAKDAKTKTGLATPDLGAIIKVGELDPETGKRLVSEAPMMAISGMGQGYESTTTVERHWSDGSVDYRCMICPFHRPGRLGIRGHFGMHVRNGEAERFDRDKVTMLNGIDRPDGAGEIHRRPKEETTDGTLAEAIQAVMEKGMDWTDLVGVSKTLAEVATAWHDQHSGPVASGSEPTAAENVLIQIRRLVDDGEANVLRASLDAAEQRAALAEAAATKARDTLNSFADLAKELRESGI